MDFWEKGCVGNMRFIDSVNRYVETCEVIVRVDERTPATAIMDSLKPKTLDRLRAAITKKIKQPQRRAVNIKSLERQLEKQNRKFLVLDADMVGPVQAEIRRLRREIEQAKRTHRDSKQRDQGH